MIEPLRLDGDGVRTWYDPGVIQIDMEQMECSLHYYLGLYYANILTSCHASYENEIGVKGKSM